MIARIKNIIVNPKSEWDVIKAEDTNYQSVIMKFLLPLVVLAAVTQIIGLYLWGYFSTGYVISESIKDIVWQIVALAISAVVINELARTFSSKKNLDNATKLVVYASTPGLVAAIVANLSVYLAWILLFGLYGIYLYWVGVSKMMETPEGKRAGYAIASIVVIIIVNIVVFSLLGFVFRLV